MSRSIQKLKKTQKRNMNKTLKRNVRKSMKKKIVKRKTIKRGKNMHGGRGGVVHRVTPAQLRRRNTKGKKQVLKPIPALVARPFVVLGKLGNTYGPKMMLKAKKLAATKHLTLAAKGLTATSKGAAVASAGITAVAASPVVGAATTVGTALALGTGVALTAQQLKMRDTWKKNAKIELNEKISDFLFREYSEKPLPTDPLIIYTYSKLSEFGQNQGGRLTGLFQCTSGEQQNCLCDHPTQYSMDGAVSSPTKISQDDWNSAPNVREKFHNSVFENSGGSIKFEDLISKDNRQLYNTDYFKVWSVQNYELNWAHLFANIFTNIKRRGLEDEETVYTYICGHHNNMRGLWFRLKDHVVGANIFGGGKDLKTKRNRSKRNNKYINRRNKKDKIGGGLKDYVPGFYQTKNLSGFMNCATIRIDVDLKEK